MKAEAAFKWIIEILLQHRVPFQITGGLAAHAYGATRPINDIDIEIPEDRFNDIVEEVKPHIVYGPAQFKDKVFEVLLMTLKYQGETIDISGAYKVKICDERTGIWYDMPADISIAQKMEVWGMTAPVAHWKELLEYKTILYADSLGGAHQKHDIDAIHQFARVEG